MQSEDGLSQDTRANFLGTLRKNKIPRKIYSSSTETILTSCLAVWRAKERISEVRSSRPRRSLGALSYLRKIFAVTAGFQKGNNMQKAPNQPARTLFKLLLSGRWLFHCILTAAGLRLSAAVNLQAATRNSVQLKCNTKKSDKNKSSRHAGKPMPGIPLLGQPSAPATKLILLQQKSCRRISPLLLQRSSAAPRLMYGEITISAVAWIYSNLGHEMS